MVSTRLLPQIHRILWEEAIHSRSHCRQWQNTLLSSACWRPNCHRRSSSGWKWEGVSGMTILDEVSVSAMRQRWGQFAILDLWFWLGDCKDYDAFSLSIGSCQKAKRHKSCLKHRHLAKTSLWQTFITCDERSGARSKLSLTCKIWMTVCDRWGILIWALVLEDRGSRLQLKF